MQRRLEKIVEPTGYRLELEPFLEATIFKGQVTINVTWLKDADEIHIHCAPELEIIDCEVKAHFLGHHRSDTWVFDYYVAATKIEFSICISPLAWTSWYAYFTCGIIKNP